MNQASAKGPTIFRSVFKTIDKDLLRWFPGHMEKGLKQMQHKLRSVDCILEVHDARIPISGLNPDFKLKLKGIKPHILVLNKVDLIDPLFIQPIKENLRNEYENIIFTQSKNQYCKGLKELFPMAQRLIRESNRHNRANEEDCCIMIIGIPNVGKSSIINALRLKHLKKGKATRVGALPGITRSVMHKIKLSEKPLFYMLDTPGISSPSIPNIETGLKLALCATLEEHMVGETILADYLLFWLNKNGHFDYVQFFGLDKPTDNILDVLTHIAKLNNYTIRLRDNLNNYILRPNLNLSAQIMIRAFRVGNLGKIVLDKDMLNIA